MQRVSKKAGIYQLKRISRVKKQFIKIGWPAHQKYPTIINMYYFTIKLLNK